MEDYTVRYREHEGDGKMFPKIELIKMSAALVFSIVTKLSLVDADIVSGFLSLGCDRELLLREFPTLRDIIIEGDSIRGAPSSKRGEWVRKQIRDTGTGEVFCIHVLPKFLSWETYYLTERESEEQEWYLNTHKYKQNIELVNRYYDGELELRQNGKNWHISTGSQEEWDVSNPDDYLKVMAKNVIELVKSGKL